jgi:hypothetical protein
MVFKRLMRPAQPEKDTPILESENVRNSVGCSFISAGYGKLRVQRDRSSA